MKDTVKAALITGVLGVVASIVTGIFTYKAGAENVEQRIDNQISQVVEVNNGDVDAAVEDLTSRIEELEDDNKSLKEQLEGTQTVTGDSGQNTGSYSDTGLEEDGVGKTNIFELLPFKENGGDFVSSSNGYKDNLGNTYPDGYLIMYNHMVNIDKEVCYVLDQKYSTLSGTIALNYANKDIKDGLWIEFYSNDKMIAQTESLSSGVKPIEFSVDVSQVSELTIRINGGGYSGGILTQGFYLE